MNMENPFGESLQNPLEKYGRDITKAAKDGKIDPVLVKLLSLKDLLKELLKAMCQIV